MYIYKITSPFGKSYIGQTNNFRLRMNSHNYDSKKRTGCRCLNNAIIKYGWNNLTKEILLICEDKDSNYYESSCIFLYDSCVPGGYNLTFGGNTNKNHNSETRIIQSKRKGGKPFYAIKNNEIVGEWLNQSDCGKVLGIKRALISRCLQGKCLTSSGYYFIFKDDLKDNDIPTYLYNLVKNKQESGRENVPFKIYKDNKYIGEWKSVLYCVKELGIIRQNLIRCLNGERVSCNGYVAIYSEKVENDFLSAVYKQEWLESKHVESLTRKGYKWFEGFKEGKKIGEWIIKSKCANDLKINYSNLGACLKGKRKYCQGYSFKYKEITDGINSI